MIGTFLEIVLAVSGIGSALALYPVLKRQNKSLALGYVIFRTMEGTIIMIGILSILTVLTLRLDFLAAGGDASVYQVVGIAFMALQKWTFLFGPNFALSINATILGNLLYKSKLVPRAISSLYLFDAPILFISSIFILFGFYEQTATFAVLIAMPLLAFEVSFAVYLIAKGFRPSALSLLFSKTD